MANKLKQHKSLRDVWINRMIELKTVAEDALADDKIRTQLKLRFVDIDSVAHEFQSNHLAVTSLSATMEGYDLGAEEEIRKTFDNNFYRVKEIYYELFEQTTQPKLETQMRLPSVKLPKIDLPKFSGNVRDWPSFIDLYKALIHDNASLSKTEKFQYFLSSLSKNALTCVKSINLTDDNYDIAFKTLVDRYQNQRLLASAYWQEIVDSPKLNSDSANDLRILLDCFHENLEGLRNLKLPIDSWSFVLFHMLIKKLNTDLVKRFELQYASTNIPTYSALITFLKSQCTALESANLNSTRKSQVPHFKKNNSPSVYASRDSNVTNRTSSFMTGATRNSCLLCNAPHSLIKCSNFLKKQSFDRFTFAKQKVLCLNCLEPGHRSNYCPIQSVCTKCGAKHHDLLHFINFPSTSQRQMVPAISNQENISQSQSTSTNSSQDSHNEHESRNVISNCSISREMVHCSKINASISVLLATALVTVVNAEGHSMQVRVMLDSASQASFITSSCCDSLRLHRSQLSLEIRGLGKMTSKAHGGVTFDIRPVGKLFPIVTVDAYIIQKICEVLPSNFVPRQNWSHLANIKLADPQFNSPHAVDILLGADVFPSVLLDGQLRGGRNEPMALNTIFGWVITGKALSSHSDSVNSHCATFDIDVLNSNIKKFWEIENIPRTDNYLSDDEKLCEKIFTETFTRDISGRYSVSLPFKNGEPSFVDTRPMALRRFLSLERRLKGDMKLYESYASFMKDYLESNHMSIACGTPKDSTKIFYIPHFCVIKPESVSTKLRVVFDASAAPSGGTSLNQTLLIGPKLQKDLSKLLLSFRCHRYVITADIRQMYRQILIHPKHRDYQRILWRFDSQNPVQEFDLNTVTYGVSSSPYLAIRVLFQLAQDEKDNFPLGSASLLNDVYIDDLITGCSNLEDTQVLQKDIIALLQKAGFELRKWASNHPSLLDNFPDEFRYQPSLSFEKDDDSIIKILGLKWFPCSDTFSYKVDLDDRKCTKRTILSDLARIFDPLGFVAPISFYAKYFMQYLWTLGVEWDQEPPAECKSRWIYFRKELKYLSSIKIPRYFGSQINNMNYQLHGFCDASERGFAAVVYIRNIHSNSINSSIVIGKSKVAPLKKISLARLELCAAVLLADLLTFVVETIGSKISLDCMFAWSDSMDTLYWIKSEPHRWQTFVANRVSRIHDRMAPSCWRYVSSKDNPADCASRGSTPTELLSHPLWWTGPKWLEEAQDSWPTSVLTGNDTSVAVLKEAKKIVFATHISADWMNEFLEKYSSWEKILRITSYLFRFIHNVRNIDNKKIGPIFLPEMHQSEIVLVKLVQSISFQEEISSLRAKRALSKSFRKLAPFLDDNGIILVGGRLDNSSLPHSQKHPILLPQKHRLTYLLIEHYHLTHLHPGLQTLRCLIVQNYWILNAKRAIRHVISRCNRCFRVRPITLTPYMSNLPPLRVNQVKTFSVVGVDFGGPFSVTMSKFRGAKTYKAYLCLFVCFATRAIHIELASELSCEAFLAALRRFIARRGRCSIIHSDCGTNFVAGSKYIRDIFQNAAREEKIEFRFNCPSSPHFGGIWEAGIKSTKTHIARVVGEQILSFEEFSTVLAQIEAVLNSRPLCELSSDPNDLNALTPGHFLTLEPLTCLPDPDFSNTKINRLSRWQLLQKIHRDFWKRWHLEYLNTLQQRQKWTKDQSKLTVGKLVLIKDELQPPLRWRLGRVVQLYSGSDGRNRVASVKTTSGIFQRPLVKLCPLPSQ